MSKFDGARLAAVLAAASAVTACERHTDNGWDASNGASRVCVDQQGQRVPEARCGEARQGGMGMSPFLWYYLGSMSRGGYVPAYGGMVSGGGYRPSPGVSYGAAPASGISRGGFGGTASSFGGEGSGE